MPGVKLLLSLSLLGKSYAKNEMDHPTDKNLPERLGKIYASPEALEERILAMEERVARSARAIIKAGPLLEDVELLRELERNLEWFLTWRLKLAETSTVMWCDGVIDLAIHSQEELSYTIQAKAYIGPERDASTTLCAFDGRFALAENTHRLRSYTVKIAYEDELLIMTDSI